MKTPSCQESPVLTDEAHQRLSWDEFATAPFEYVFDKPILLAQAMTHFRLAANQLQTQLPDSFKNRLKNVGYSTTPLVCNVENLYFAELVHRRQNYAALSNICRERLLALGHRLPSAETIIGADGLDFPFDQTRQTIDTACSSESRLKRHINLTELALGGLQTSLQQFQETSMATDDQVLKVKYEMQTKVLAVQVRFIQSMLDNYQAFFQKQYQPVRELPLRKKAHRSLKALD